MNYIIVYITINTRKVEEADAKDERNSEKGDSTKDGARLYEIELTYESCGSFR